MHRASAYAGCLVGLIVGTLGVHAQASPPERIISIEVYGDDPCPGSLDASDSVILVCGRKPESERYRIPAELRQTRTEHIEQAWGSQVQDVEAVSRSGRPDSCSPVGSAGQTGCYRRSRDQWRAERRLLDSAE